MKSRGLAPSARLELTTLRLGGVRSILVSYGGICGYYSNQIFRACQEIPAHFLGITEYTAM